MKVGKVGIHNRLVQSKLCPYNVRNKINTLLCRMERGSG
jgi:hypothetical protein